MLYGSPYGRYGEAAFGGSTSPKDGGSAVSGPSDDVIALRHLRAGGGDCFGRLIARWSSFMHVSVYLEAESPCQFPVFQTTHFGALVRLLFHELLGLQLRRLLRWSSIGAREGFYLLCSLLLEPWIIITTFLGKKSCFYVGSKNLFKKTFMCKISLEYNLKTKFSLKQVALQVELGEFRGNFGGVRKMFLKYLSVRCVTKDTKLA